MYIKLGADLKKRRECELQPNNPYATENTTSVTAAKADT